jgi:hypothetical protein
MGPRFFAIDQNTTVVVVIVKHCRVDDKRSDNGKDSERNVDDERL